MNKHVSLIALMGILMATSCSTTKNSQKESQASMDNTIVKMGNMEETDANFLILSDAQRAYVEKNNQMAFNFFSQVSGFDSKVISPVSLSYLMGMLANGANGNTQAQILKTLGCDGNITLEELNAFNQWMLSHAGKQDASVEVNIANYIALNKNHQLKADYSKKMADFYKAGIESLDFSSQKTTKHINDWCSKHTDGMIPSIIDQVEPNAVSYIMNAVFFNGTWQDKFEKNETKLEPFRGYTRDIKRVNMMHRNGKYMYMSNDDYSAVRLPYGKGRYVMTVLLPNEGKSIDEMMSKVNAESFAAISRNMDECVVDLKLPRFTSEVDLSLNDIVSKLGAPSMFLPGEADFSNFSDANVYVSKMIQKAKIEVSEEGTKAAAVTAAMVMMTSLNPSEPRHVEFHANRPFVYMITEAQSGCIFFMGQYTGQE